MEDIVVVAGRICTNAVLVELVCAGPSRRTAAGVESLPLHTLGRRCHGRRLRLRKSSGLSRLCSTLDSELSCTDEDDIAVIARKLPYCCCRYITVIRSNVLNVDHNGLPRP
jgi:hypothetical protein